MTNINQFIRHYSFLHGLGGFIMGFIAPIMYVVLKGKGFEMIEIGLLILCSSLTTILFEIPCGVLSDKIGRKCLFIFGQIIFLLFCLCMFLLDSLVIMMAAMALAGLSAAMVSGTLDAIFVDTLNQNNKTPEFLQQSIAKVGMYNMLGMFVGALLSGVLVKHQVDIEAVSGFENNYGLVALMLPLQMALCMWLIKEPAQSNSQVERQGLYTLFCQAFAYLAQHQTLKSLMISSAVGAMAYISFEKLWQLQLLEITGKGQMKWIFGILFATSLVVGATGQQLSNQLCKIFNNNYVNAIILVRLLHAGLFLLLYITEQLPAFVIIFVLIYFVSALSFSPVMTLFHSEIENSKRSTMLSFRSVFIQLGAAIGVVTAALISHFVTLHAAFLTSAGIYLLSIGLLMQPSVASLGAKLSSLAAQKNEM